MAISNINRVGGTPSQIQTDSLKEQEGIARQELFTSETFEKTRSLNLSDGSTAPIANSFGKNETVQIQAFLSTLSPEHTQNLQAAGNMIATEASAAVAAGGDIAAVTASLSEKGSNIVNNTLVASTGINEQSLQDATNSVMAFGMGGIDGQIYGLATTLESGNKAKQDIRETMTELRDEISDPSTPWPQTFSWNEYGMDDNGNLTVTERTESLTKAEAESLLENLEDQLSTVGENTQLWQMDLQNAMQKQSELMNIFAAILKNMHDTMAATIRNVKA
jgi:hypothetical protein